MSETYRRIGDQIVNIATSRLGIPRSLIDLETAFRSMASYRQEAERFRSVVARRQREFNGQLWGQLSIELWFAVHPDSHEAYCWRQACCLYRAMNRGRLPGSSTTSRLRKKRRSALRRAGLL